MSQVATSLQRSGVLLRPFVIHDIAPLQVLLNDKKVVANIVDVPYPYTQTHAKLWVTTASRARTEGHHRFAVVDKKSEVLVGGIGLRATPNHGHAEIGYWVGSAFWRQGYGRTSVALAVQYGFSTLKLHRIFGYCFTSNTGSIHILRQQGFQQEGFLRQHIYKEGQYHDVLLLALLREQIQ